DEAIAAHEAAMKLAPGDLDVHLSLGALYLKKGDLARAREHADAALRLGEGDPAAARLSAQVLVREGKHAEAAADYEAVVAAVPEDAEARLALARALIRAERPEAAIPHLERLAKERPDEAVIWSEWGGALTKLGKVDGPEGALARLDHALELKADLLSARVRRIAALTAGKRCKEARSAHAELVAAVADAREQADMALGSCAKGKGK
ncbi:MAG: tetratricopeptide repeat protein, partial [Myxococcales bacterium]|nr:tetratricopeptide repeat protein [Myxococcales bacterium]